MERVAGAPQRGKVCGLHLAEDTVNNLRGKAQQIERHDAEASQ